MLKQQRYCYHRGISDVDVWLCRQIVLGSGELLVKGDEDGGEPETQTEPERPDRTSRH